VKPAPFTYLRPEALDEALSALAEGGDDEFTRGHTVGERLPGKLEGDVESVDRELDAVGVSNLQADLELLLEHRGFEGLEAHERNLGRLEVPWNGRAGREQHSRGQP